MKRPLSENPYPRVAVCVDKSRSYGRRVLRGIARYVELHGPWSLSVDPRASGAYDARWLKNWRGDGVLAFIEALPAGWRRRASSVPIVELFGHRLDLHLPQVSNDEAAIGKMAAEHLLERQFRRLAFIGYSGLGWSGRREEGFVERARASGVGVATFYCRYGGHSLAVWERDQLRVTRFLSGLAKPVGIMACSDRLGTRVLDACQRADLAVPEEMAVIGVDNDEETCLLGHPPLSSVIDDAEQVGFVAAGLLDEMMANRGRRPRGKRILIAPLGVATRRSTEVSAIEDPLVARAARLIRERACEGLTVAQLVAELRLSRSLLYRRFKGALGRHPHEEILRVKLDRVKSLLLQSSCSIEEAAARTGFSHPEYLSVAFKREFGVTPARFRRARGTPAAVR